jgi:hypothetical protein
MRASPFFSLAIYGQEVIFKIKSAKIKCFLRFSIAEIQTEFKKNRQISILASCM